jgi:hypothetical protein
MTGCGGWPALSGRGIGKGDTVAVICQHSKSSNAISPYCEAVLNVINTRLDAGRSPSSSITAKRAC